MATSTQPPRQELRVVSSEPSPLPRQLEREGTLLAQLASLTEPDALNTSYLTHGIHPYPAKYIPQLPNLIIREHTNERNRILDPFCGSGTSLLEAAILGRKSVGIDSNPVAAVVSSAKTTALSERELAAAEEFLARAEQLKPKATFRTGHSTLNLDHWFQKNVMCELDALRTAIARHQSPSLRTFLLCLLSSIVVSVSNQESETRYAAKNKNIADGATFKRYFSKLQKELPRIRELSEMSKVRRNRPIVLQSDIRTVRSKRLPDNSIDLIVTSPPYPNSFDYYLYHKWRMFWLGADYKEVQTAEIGSRNEHSSKRQPIDTYITKMQQAINQMAKVLKPSKLAYFFVGDAVIDGKLLDIGDVFSKVIRDTDLRLVADTNYSLEAITRSFREKTSSNCHGGRRNEDKKQHVLVFERVNRSRLVVASDRTKATPLPELAQIDLATRPALDRQVIALKTNDSARHVHSLGRYPSKFIPEIPRWAVDSFSRPGDLVLDPFSGSGTTAVEAILQGRRTIGTDVSPYASLLGKAKTCWFDSRELMEVAGQFESDVRSGLKGIDAEPRSFPLDDFWFPRKALEQIAACQKYISTSVPPQFSDFMTAVLSTIVRSTSFQDEGQIKVKRDPKKVLHGTPEPFALLPEAIRKSAARKAEYLSLLKEKPDCRIVNVSANELVSRQILRAGCVDLIVTSPPYINAMNYPMTHRAESFVLGLLDPQTHTVHERRYFGSERVYSHEYSKVSQFATGLFPHFDQLNAALAKIHDGEPKRSFIAYRFFSLMFQTLSSLSDALKQGGIIVLVAGRNTIKGVPLDTVGLLGSMLEACGLTRRLSFEYEIIKNAFKLTRHATADIIKRDGVLVYEKGRSI